MQTTRDLSPLLGQVLAKHKSQKDCFMFFSLFVPEGIVNMYLY